MRLRAHLPCGSVKIAHYVAKLVIAVALLAHMIYPSKWAATWTRSACDHATVASDQQRAPSYSAAPLDVRGASIAEIYLIMYKEDTGQSELKELRTWVEATGGTVYEQINDFHYLKVGLRLAAYGICSAGGRHALICTPVTMGDALLRRVRGL